MDLSESQELFLEYLEVSPTIKEASRLTGVSESTGYEWSSKLKEVIQSRAKDKLAVATLRAVNTAVELLDADSSTEKGELRLKAAESVMDRTGLTKHTNVEVQHKVENGIFILPAKTEVTPEDS